MCRKSIRSRRYSSGIEKLLVCEITVIYLGVSERKLSCSIRIYKTSFHDPPKHESISLKRKKMYTLYNVPVCSRLLMKWVPSNNSPNEFCKSNNRERERQLPNLSFNLNFLHLHIYLRRDNSELFQESRIVHFLSIF